MKQNSTYQAFIKTCHNLVLTVVWMVLKSSSVPLSDELRDLASFIVDGFNGLSNFAVEWMLKFDLLSASCEKNIIRFSIVLVILNNIEMIKHEGTCKISLLVCKVP